MQAFLYYSSHLMKLKLVKKRKELLVSSYGRLAKSMVARETKTHTQLFFQKIDPMQFNGLLPAREELKKKPLAQ